MMDFTIHNQALLSLFTITALMCARVNKTNFCAMGALSDWVDMGDTGPRFHADSRRHCPQAR